MRWTNKRIAEQLGWSNVCYRKAIMQHYGHLLNSEQKKLPMHGVKTIICERLKIKNITSPEVNTLYLEKLCKLDTQKLELIIEAYNKGKQYRSASTIDVLLSELFERSINRGKRKK